MRALSEPAQRLRQRAARKVLALKARLGMKRQVFTDIYRFGMWGGVESRSGQGSSMASTQALRVELPSILTRFGIRTMLDAGCGDCNWMSRMDLDLDLYVGVEIVPALVEANRRRIWKDVSYRREFMALNIARDPLPCVDMIFCRHCLIHLPLRDVRACLDNFRSSGSKYLMATTVPDCHVNHDVRPGGFRPLNLELPPFSLPQPLARLNDIVVIEGQERSDGWLYLWDLRALT